MSVTPIIIPEIPDAPAMVQRRISAATPRAGAPSPQRTLSASMESPAFGGGGSVSVFYGVHSIQGVRPTMEDAHKVKSAATDGEVPMTPTSSEAPSLLDGSTKFFGVFDGHAGSKCAEFVASSIFDHISAHPAFGGSEPNIEAAVREGVLATEKAWMERAVQQDESDGTTAVLAVLAGRAFTVANVGDSEAVVSQKGVPIAMTTIHNPGKNPAEEERVIQEGGRIWRHRVGHPVWNPQFLNIAVSRAIGDLSLKQGVYTENKPTGLIADPDVQTLQLNLEHEFAILACDGLWDVCTHQEAIDFASELLDVMPAPRPKSSATVNVRVRTTRQKDAQAVTMTVPADIMLYEFKQMVVGGDSPLHLAAAHSALISVARAADPTTPLPSRKTLSQLEVTPEDVLVVHDMGEEVELPDPADHMSVKVKVTTKALVDWAFRRGSRDNITALIIKFDWSVNPNTLSI